MRRNEDPTIPCSLLCSAPSGSRNSPLPAAHSGDRIRSIAFLSAGGGSAIHRTVRAQDLESAPGSFEFQSQNAWSWGQPPRRIASDAEGVEFDENEVIRERYAIELEMGLTSI